MMKLCSQCRHFLLTPATERNGNGKAISATQINKTAVSQQQMNNTLACISFSSWTPAQKLTFRCSAAVPLP